MSKCVKQLELSAECLFCVAALSCEVTAVAIRNSIAFALTWIGFDRVPLFYKETCSCKISVRSHFAAGLDTVDESEQ